MTTVERIRKECKDKKIPVSRLERDCGFSNGYINSLKKGTVPDHKLEKIAEKLGVSKEYLLTGEESSSIGLQNDYVISGNDDLNLLIETVKDAPSDVLVRLRYYAEGLMAGRKDQT